MISIARHCVIDESDFPLAISGNVYAFDSTTIDLCLDVFWWDHYIKIENTLRTDFYFNDICLSDEFMVVPDLGEDANIGANTMQKWRIKSDFENDTVIIDPKAAKLILKELN